MSFSSKDNIKALVEEEADKMLFGLSERKSLILLKKSKGLMSLLEDVINSSNEEDALLTPERRKAEVKKEINNYLCRNVAVETL